eukprot:5491280-Amphidinium_carterae.2
MVAGPKAVANTLDLPPPVASDVTNSTSAEMWIATVLARTISPDSGNSQFRHKRRLISRQESRPRGWEQSM